MRSKLGGQILHFLLPSIISALVLYVLTAFIHTEGGPSTTVLYMLSLFIAGGYFFVSAVLLYMMKLLRAMVPSKEEKLKDLKKELEYLKGLKKNIERRYYFKKDLDEDTFRQELQEVARREIEIEEKLAQLKSEKKKGKTKESKQELKTK